MTQCKDCNIGYLITPIYLHTYTCADRYYLFGTAACFNVSLHTSIRTCRRMPMPIHMSVYKSTHMAVYMSTHMSAYMSVHRHYTDQSGQAECLPAPPGYKIELPGAKQAERCDQAKLTKI